MSDLVVWCFAFFPYYDGCTMYPHALSCFAWIFKQRVKPKGKESLILEPKVNMFSFI